MAKKLNLQKARKSRKGSSVPDADDQTRKDILVELRLIRRLLVMHLLGLGAGSRAVAEWLAVDKGNFSRDFPVKKLFKKSD
jgi:hypothetical protein